MWPFNSRRILPFREHAMWKKGPTMAEGVFENMHYSTQFDSPHTMIFTADTNGHHYLRDPYGHRMYRVEHHVHDGGRPDDGPDIVLHTGMSRNTVAFGFIKRNRDYREVRQVLGIRTSYQDQADLILHPVELPRSGLYLFPNAYKHVRIESRIANHILRTRKHSFRVQVPGTNGLKEIFVWKHTSGAEVQNFQDALGKYCVGQWKLVRAATNEVVAVYISDWHKSKPTAKGYLKFLRNVHDLGAEFELLASLCVLAVLRNERF